MQEELNVGLSTNHVVLQFQDDLSQAQFEELRAAIDYNKHWAQLKHRHGAQMNARGSQASQTVSSLSQRTSVLLNKHLVDDPLNVSDNRLACPAYRLHKAFLIHCSDLIQSNLASFSLE